METRIQGIFPHKDRYQIVDIFGYSTKGLPGIEILGMGKHGRSLKEKFVYISRTFKMPIPHRRYVMCGEIDESLIGKGDLGIQFLELPLLLLFWTMANQLPIKRLSDCICGGKVSVNGKVKGLEIKREVLDKIGEGMKEVGDLKLITPNRFYVPESICHLPLEGLISETGLSVI